MATGKGWPRGAGLERTGRRPAAPAVVLPPPEDEDRDMRKSLVALILAPLALLAAGCSPVVLSSSPGMVIVGNAATWNLPQAAQLAESRCSQYGRHAVFVPDNVADGQATYECK